MTSETIHRGMTVVGRDGERVGQIVHVAADGFLVQRGRFWPREYLARFEDIDSIGQSEVKLALVAEELSEWSPPQQSAAAPEATAHEAEAFGGAHQEVRVKLYEEQLVPEKHLRQSGRVRVIKEIKTEYRTITVPVRHEDLRIERIPMGEVEKAGDEVLSEEEISTLKLEATETEIPLLEEVVEVKLVPRVRERVRIIKDVRVREERFSGNVRREVATVSRDGDKQN